MLKVRVVIVSFSMTLPNSVHGASLYTTLAAAP